MKSGVCCCNNTLDVPEVAPYKTALLFALPSVFINFTVLVAISKLKTVQVNDADVNKPSAD
jgi:hypothetical protein